MALFQMQIETEHPILLLSDLRRAGLPPTPGAVNPEWVRVKLGAMGRSDPMASASDEHPKGRYPDVRTRSPARRPKRSGRQSRPGGPDR